jgi:protein tyrosine phosphatase (PTP) superfamily phosphohydrolase (DUF442 family)
VSGNLGPKKLPVNPALSPAESADVKVAGVPNITRSDICERPPGEEDEQVAGALGV